MEAWKGAILGVIQGLTEFLPVSSSGHLEIASALFGMDEPNNLSFTVAVHLATVLATITVFRKDIWKILSGVFKFRLNDQSVYFLNILVSMLPILLVGLLFKDEVESLFTGNLIFVGSMLILTGALLAFSNFAKSGSSPITPKRAFVIGLAQALAVLPGLSRSGATISAGLLQGVKKEEVAKFSFLMVIIPILGISFLDILKGGFVPSEVNSGVLTGFITAFFTGFFACKAMIKIVSKGKLIWFAIYCVLLGLTSIALGIFGCQ